MTSTLPYLAALAVVAAMVLASGGQVRPRTMALHGLLTAALVASAVHVMGRPKPLWAEIAPREEIEVIAAQYHPGIGIYVWARMSPPVVYALPWDVGLAREMQEAMRDGDGFLLKQRGEADMEISRQHYERGWTVHPLPQPSNPPKEEG